MTAPQKKHLPAITETKDIGQLLRDMDSYNGMTSTMFAYRLIPYLMLRPNELVTLKWDNIDFEHGLIRLERHRMKKRLLHVVPMARQVIDIMRLLHDYSGHCEYILTRIRDKQKKLKKSPQI